MNNIDKKYKVVLLPTGNPDWVKNQKEQITIDKLSARKVISTNGYTLYFKTMEEYRRWEETKQNDSIHFAQWINENGWSTSGGDSWEQESYASFYDEYPKYVFKRTEELYQLFKSEKEMTKEELTYGYLAGEICNRDGCPCIIEQVEDDEPCTCFINPPCSHCCNLNQYCPECNWENN